MSIDIKYEITLYSRENWNEDFDKMLVYEEIFPSGGVGHVDIEVQDAYCWWVKVLMSRVYLPIGSQFEVDMLSDMRHRLMIQGFSSCTINAIGKQHSTDPHDIIGIVVIRKTEFP